MKKIVLLDLNHSKQVTNAVSYNRCILPYSYCKDELAKDDIILELTNQVNSFDFDALVLHRGLKYEYAAYLEQFLDKGKTIGFGLDDDVFHIEKSNPAYKSYDEAGLEGVNWLISVSKSVCVSSKALKKQINHERVYICPNLIDINAFVDIIPEDPKTRTRVVWTGSNTHADDIELLTPILDSLLPTDEYEFYFQTDLPVKYQRWQRIPGSNMALLAPPLEHGDKLCLVQTVELKDYLGVLKTIDADVGLIPLQNNLFNQAKSNLTFLNYAYCGIPVVASDVGEYSKLKDYAIITDDFEYGVKNCIGNINTKMAKDYVEQMWSWQYSKEISNWLAFYKSLVCGNY